MIDLSQYFDAISRECVDSYDLCDGTLGKEIKIYYEDSEFPDLTDIKLAIIGVEEERKSVHNEGCSNAPNEIRKYLYKLFLSSNMKPNICDLGNLILGYEVTDTYASLANVMSELIKNNILPIIIGGSNDLAYGQYRGYESLGQIINIVSVDCSFDLGRDQTELNSKSYLSRIILHQPSYLFNFANIGYQTYFVDKEAISLMSKLYFDAYRLGLVRANMEEVEPIVRNADMLIFDISAIRYSDAPGNGNATPNGFYGEEACQITRYAGMSDKLSSIGFYEMNPLNDRNGQTAHLVAQMIWYFIEGYFQRKNDFPLIDKKDYIKYRVALDDNKTEIVFYKSKKSDRWWMEVPYPDELTKYERHHLVPCSYSDYLTACKNEIPDRWWQAYQKIT